MQIVVSVIESNPRRGGIAFNNGVRVDVADAALVGTDKQIAWATQIMVSALKETAESGVRKMAGKDLLCDGAKLDEAVSKLNAMMGQVAVKLAAHGTNASQWIDNRNKSARDLLNLMMGV